MLRKIFGAKRDEVTGEWKKLHNTELHALYSSPDTIRNIKSRRLRWAGHVARMGESRNVYRFLVGRPEGKRPLGRPRRRWEDNIKMDLRENIVRNGTIKIGDLSFEEVEKFKYLGATVTNLNDTREEIKRRINMGNACYYSVEKLLSSSLLSKSLKVRIYKTVILPVLLYGCETWTLTLREEQRLRVFENKVLRKIFGAKREEVTGEWRKLHNAELHALYTSPDIIRNIKSRRLRWAGHVARMGESRNAYRVLVGRPEEKDLWGGRDASPFNLSAPIVLLKKVFKYCNVENDRSGVAVVTGNVQKRFSALRVQGKIIPLHLFKDDIKSVGSFPKVVKVSMMKSAVGDRPSSMIDDRVELVRQCIMENRHFTITELSSHFPQISRSLLHEIVTKHLLFKKVFARWVPKNLTPEHKMQRLGAALTFLQRYHNHGDEFLDNIVTGDETWISHFTPQTKQQSMHWRHSGSPVRTKFKQTLSVRKVMCTVFWDRKGILLIDFLPRGETVNADRYCETLRKLRRAIENKRRGMLTAVVMDAIKTEPEVDPLAVQPCDDATREEENPLPDENGKEDPKCFTKRQTQKRGNKKKDKNARCGRKGRKSKMEMRWPRSTYGSPEMDELHHNVGPERRTTACGMTKKTDGQTTSELEREVSGREWHETEKYGGSWHET
ncbi:hypothetical protein ANN_27897 [Periplaneta americana]|uniref:Uncharacterized protein n=1 Tax=Periplaneta americana TaxID=6978 RepID=A0ABQ8RVJ8_PERAM|nr:hypothetical protein ANN_27897 [Periplaneta americana]